MNNSSGADSRRRRTTSYRGPPFSPLQQWKLHDVDDHRAARLGYEASARKLAADLWKLRFSEISRGIELDSSFEIASSLKCAKKGMIRAIRRDPCCSKESAEMHCGVTNVSMVSALSDELMQARSRVRELEAKKKSFGKRVEHFLKKFEEKNVAWKHRDFSTDYAVIKDVMRELSREKEIHQRMETLGKKLVSRLAYAELATDKFMKNCEKEKKDGRFMEDVCNELAKYARENKVKLKALKRESMNIIDELDGERKMLHMAESWREERVQMKLIDAKLALEDKYHQVNKLITDIETFLRSKFTNLDMPDLRKAELILQEVKLLNIQDIEEFCNVSLKSDDIISTSEAFHSNEETKRAIKPSICHSASTRDYESHPVSPDHDSFKNCSAPSYANGLNHCGHGSISIGESKYSTDQSSLDTEIIEVCSVSEHKSEQKPPSIAEVWRSCQTNSEVSIKALQKDKCMLSNPDSRLTKPETKHRHSKEHMLTLDISNPHISRGIQGRIQWPRAIQKNSSNAKALEAKIESQRSQLRRVYKQRFL